MYSYIFGSRQEKLCERGREKWSARVQLIRIPQHRGDIGSVLECVCVCVCACLHIQWGRRSTAKNFSSFIKLIHMTSQIIVLKCYYKHFQEMFAGSVFT